MLHERPVHMFLYHTDRSTYCSFGSFGYRLLLWIWENESCSDRSDIVRFENISPSLGKKQNVFLYAQLEKNFKSFYYQYQTV
jgi:hypothetical protein